VDGYGYAAEAVVKVGADTAQAERGLTTVSGQINALGGLGASAGQALNRGLTFGATAIAGLATASIGAAAGFDQQMRNVNSIAQLSKEAFEDMRSEVLEFSLTTRAGANGVADALYQVVSAGMSLDETMGTAVFRGKEMSEGMAVLQAASSAAGAGLAETDDTIKLLISALGAYNLEASEVGRVTDIFLHTVNEGLTTLPELAGTLGRILPTAANLGVSLEEVGYAMAQMTQTGLSTEEATTRLNAVMTSLLKPSEAMDDVLGRLGVTSGTQLIEKFGGLMGAVSALTKTEFENTLVTGGMNKAQAKMAEDLPYMRRELALANEELAKMTSAEKPNTIAIERKRIAIERKRISIEKLTDKIADYEASLAGVLPVTQTVTKTTFGSNEALAEMFNNVRSLGGALALMSDDATLSADGLREFTEAADGALERMRAEQYKSFNSQMGLLKSSVKVIAIEIGTRMLPALTSFVTEIRKFVQQYGPPMLDFLDRAMEGFDRMSEPVRTVVGLFGGLFIASRSLGTVMRFLSPMLGMIGISIGTISTPILALIGAVALLGKAWSDNWGNVRDYITQEIAPGLQNAIGGIKQMLSGIWEGLTTGDWEGVKQKIKYGWLMAIDGAREAFEGARDGIVGWASGLWQRVVDWWTEGGGQEWAQGVADSIKGALANVPGLLSDAAEGAREWLVNTWTATRTWWDEGGQEWAQGVADSIKGALAAVGGLLLDAGMDAGQWLAHVWQRIGTWWDESGQQWASDIAGKIGTAIGKIRDFLTSDQVPTWVSAAVWWLEPVWLGMADWWTTEAQPLTDKMVSGFSAWMNSSFVPALQNEDKTTWVAGVTAALSTGIQQAVDELYSVETSSAIAHAIAKFFAKALSDAAGMLIEIPLGIGQLLVNAIFKEGGEPIDLGPAATWVKEVLGALVDGLIEGFSEGKLGQLVTAFFENFVNAVKLALGIESPSTVFHGIGVNVMEGLIEGINSLYESALGILTGLFTTVEEIWNKLFGKKESGTGSEGDSGVDTEQTRMDLETLKQLYETTYNVDLPAILEAFRLVAVDETIRTWLGVLGAMRSHLQLIRSDASTMMGNVATGIAGQRGAFSEVGASLGAGLAGGIMSKAGEIAAAAAAVVRLAIAAARAAADARSPSREMQQLGWDWVLGLIVGIEDQEPEAIKAATDLMNSVGQAASSVVQTLNNLAGYRFAPIDFDSLNIQIKEVVSNFKLLAEYFAGAGTGLDSAKAVLDPLGDIFSKLGSVLTPLVNLAAKPLPPNLPALIKETVYLLTESVPQLIQGLADLGTKFSLTTGVTAATVGQTVAAAVSAVSAIVADLTTLAAGVPRIDSSDVVSALTGSITLLVDGLAKITVDTDELRKAEDVAAALSAALAPWVDMAKAIKSIAETADFPPRVIVPVADKLKWTVFVLIGLTGWLANALNDATVAASEAAAERVVKALSPWKAMADAVKAIAGTADLPSRVIVPIADKLKWTAFVLVNMIGWIAGALDDGVLATSSAAAERVVKALSPWEAMADAVKAIADTAELPPRLIVPIADKLKWTTFVLVGMINWIAENLDDGTLAKAAAAAERIVTALSPWEAMVSAVTAIAGSVERDISVAAQGLVQMTASLVRALLLLTRPGKDGFGLTEAELQKAAELAATVGGVLTPWQDAIGVMKAMASVVIRDTSAMVIDLAAFMAELTRGILMLTNPGRDGYGLTEAMLKKAAAIAKQLADIFSPWEKAIALAEGLRMFRLMPNFVEKMVSFGRQWVEVVNQLGALILTISREGLDAVRDFGEVLENITVGLQTATELLLADTWPEPNPQVWDDFVGWVWGVFQFFYDKIQELLTDPDNVIGFDPVADFSSALESLMTALGAAVDLLRDFVFVQPDPELWQSFVDWVWGVFQFFYDKVQELVNDPENTLGFDPVVEFAGALESIMGSLSGALELAQGFVFEAPPAEQWDNFVTWVWGVFQTFYGLVQALVEDPASVIDFVPVDAFGAALQSVVSGLMAGLELARGFVFEAPPAEQWDNFVTWVWGVFQTFYGLVQALVEDPANVIDFDPITSFGDALGSLMGGLNAAIALVTGFSFTAPDATMWDGFVTWVTGVFSHFWQYVQTFQTDPEQAINFDPLASFGDALGAVMSGLGATIDLISNFVWVAPDPVIWDNFVSWVLGFMTDLRTRILTTFPDSASSAATFEPVAAFGNAISAVMSGLQGALEFLSGLAGFVPPANELVTVFLDNALIMVEQIGTYTQQHLDPARLLAVSRFSQALQDLTGGLSSALSLFDGLASLDDRMIDWLTNAGAGTGTDTGTAMQTLGYLFMAIVETLQRFHTEVVLQSGTNWIPTAQAFHAAMSSVIGILQSALTLFTNLGTSGMPSTALIEAFVQAIMQVFTTFNTGLAATLTPLTATINAIRDEIHVRLYGHLAWQGAPQPGRPYYDVGVNIVQSIGAGMLSQSSYIYQVAYNIGQTILAGLNASLGIASPSQAGWYAGTMTGEGLATGILASVSQVRSAAKVMADAAVDELARVPAQMAAPSPLWPDLRTAGPRMAPIATVEHVLTLRVEGGDKLPKMNDFEMREFARELSRHIKTGG